MRSLYKFLTKNKARLFSPETHLIELAISLIQSVPENSETAFRLRSLRITYVPDLSDRAHTSLRGLIEIGPEALAGDVQPPVGLAGTLVHEEFHTRQNPFLKTRSVYAGLFTRTHPMARYEWPAYRAQVSFLRRLAAVRPELSDVAMAEVEAVCASVYFNYGKPPFDL